MRRLCSCLRETSQQADLLLEVRKVESWEKQGELIPPARLAHVNVCARTAKTHLNDNTCRATLRQQHRVLDIPNPLQPLEKPCQGLHMHLWRPLAASIAYTGTDWKGRQPHGVHEPKPLETLARVKGVHARLWRPLTSSVAYTGTDRKRRQPRGVLRPKALESLAQGQGLRARLWRPLASSVAYTGTDWKRRQPMEKVSGSRVLSTRPNQRCLFRRSCTNPRPSLAGARPPTSSGCAGSQWRTSSQGTPVHRRRGLGPQQDWILLWSCIAKAGVRPRCMTTKTSNRQPTIDMSHNYSAEPIMLPDTCCS